MADSQDVIDSPAAAGIGSRQWGRGFYRVSASEVLPVQTALSTGVTPAQTAAGGVSLLPFRLTSGDRAGLAAEQERQGAEQGLPTDLARLVEAARRASAAAGIPLPRRPWPDPLPQVVGLHELGPAVRGLQTDASGLPAYALADDPDRQAQYPVGWDPAAGNMLIYGVVGSGATTALTALALLGGGATAGPAARLHTRPRVGRPRCAGRAAAHRRLYRLRERAGRSGSIRTLRAELNARKARRRRPRGRRGRPRPAGWC